MASKYSLSILLVAILACGVARPCLARQRTLRSQLVSKATLEKEMGLLPLAGPKRRILETFSGVISCTNLPSVGQSWEDDYYSKGTYNIDYESDGFEGGDFSTANDYADGFYSFGSENDYNDIVSLTFSAKVSSPAGAKLYVTVIDVNSGEVLEKFDSGSECIRFQYDARDTSCSTSGGGNIKVRVWCGGVTLGTDDECTVDYFSAFASTSGYCTTSTPTSTSRPPPNARPPPPYSLYTPTYYSPSSSEKKSSNIGIIAGAAVGGVVVVGAIAGLSIWMVRKNKTTTKEMREVGATINYANIEQTPPAYQASGELSKPATRPIENSMLSVPVATHPLPDLEAASPTVDDVSNQQTAANKPATPISESLKNIPAPSPADLAAQTSTRGLHLSNASTDAAASGASAALSGASRASGISMGASGALVETFEEKDFDIEECIGQGSFGRVFKAKWRRTPVALKVLAGSQGALALSDGDMKAMGQELEREATVMAGLRHPNVCQFMGIVENPPCLVTEFCSRGSLMTILREARTSPEKAAELTWQRRLGLLADAARGLLYLHSSKNGVLHRDLKSPNILVSEHWVGKVADFGLSRLLEDYHSRSTNTSGGMASNPRWLAPETLDGERYTAACDIYSLGMLLWEVLSCELPWTGVNEFAIIRLACQGKRPEIPAAADIPGPAAPKALLDGYVALMQKCWAQDPAARPQLEEVVDELERLQKMT